MFVGRLIVTYITHFQLIKKKHSKKDKEFYFVFTHFYEYFLNQSFGSFCADDWSEVRSIYSAISLTSTVNRFINSSIAFLLLLFSFFHRFCFSWFRFDLDSYLSLELVQYFFTIKLRNILLSFIRCRFAWSGLVVTVIWVTSVQGSFYCFVHKNDCLITRIFI